MADPLSLCASIVAVTGADLILSEGLYVFAKTVGEAESSITSTARDIELMTLILDQLKDVLKTDARMCKPDAMKPAANAISDCGDISSAMNASLVSYRTNDQQEFTIGKSARLKSFFKERKMNYLRTNLERLKSTLELLAGVLNLASSIEATKAHQRVSDIMEKSAEVERLAQTLVAQECKFDAMRDVFANQDTQDETVADGDLHEIARST